MTEFNWQTDEDSRWEEVATLPPTPARPTNGRNRWVALLAVVVMGAAVVGFFYLRTQRFLRQTEAQVRQEVASSYNMVMLAQQSRDGELFMSLLSGRDSHWVASQQQLLEQIGLFERDMFGLEAYGAPVLAEEAIELSADLNSALITATQVYTDGYGTAVTLAHTAQFRRGQKRWLMAPLEEEFWGPTQYHSTVRFSASYPAQDTAVVRRLLADLDQLVEQLCQPTYGLNCTNVAMPQHRIALEFSHDPAVLATLGQPLGVLMTFAEEAIALPTPTLVGLPTDEASYRALLNGYARHLLPAWTMAHSEMLCCESLLLFQGVMDIALAELKVQAWPLATADYERYFRQPFNFRANLLPTTLGGIQPVEWWLERQWEAHLLAFYVRQESSASLGEIIRLLATEPEAWVRGLLPNRTPAEHTHHLRQLLLGEIKLDLPAQVSLPTQDLLVACGGTGQGMASFGGMLMRYTTADQQWQLEPGWEESIIHEMWLSPAGREALIFENGSYTDSFMGLRTTRINLVTPQSRVAFYQATGLPETQSQFRLVRMPNMKMPLVVEYPQPQAANPTVGSRFYVVPTAACLFGTEGCGLQEIPGPLLFSPKQTHGLLLGWNARDFSGLWLTDSRGHPLTQITDNAQWPLGWLDEETFLFGQTLTVISDEPHYLVYKGHVADGQTEIWLDQHQINQLVGSDTRGPEWAVGNFLPVNDPALLLIHFYSPYDGQNRMVLYNWQTEQVMHGFAGVDWGTQGWPVQVLGRWFIWQEYGGNEFELPQVQVVDWQSGELVYRGLMGPFDGLSSVSLSADGEWLSLLQDGYLTMLHLPTGSEQIVPYPEAEMSCFGGGWWD